MALKVFVYGTLKAGFSNHSAFCSEAISVSPAWTYGQLYHLPAGYPGAIFPIESILLNGSFDVAHDVQLLGPSNPEPAQASSHEIIHGELIEFPLNPNVLEELDALEGFNLDFQLYNRVMVLVNLDQGVTTHAWSYQYALPLPPSSLKVVGGNWQEITIGR